MATNEAKIKLTAEDATGGAFTAVLKNVTNLKTELTTLPASSRRLRSQRQGSAPSQGFASMISGIVDGRAKLRDFSIETNISVEALSGLVKIGKIADTPIETIANASVKLSKALLTQTEDSKGAAQGIQALGLNYEKFKSLQPEQQLYEVAKALEGFSDGWQKSAIAQILFGKSGAEILPFLREYAEIGPQVGKTTREQAEQAYQYERNLRELRVAGDAWKKEIADYMLPTLLQLTTALIDGKEAYGNWFGFIIDSATRSPFKSIAEDMRDVGTELEELEKRWKKHQAIPGIAIFEKVGVASDATDFQQYRDQLSDRRAFLLRRQQREALALGSQLNAGYVDARTAVRKPTIKVPETENQHDALLAKQFQGELKLIREFAEQQKEGYEFANRYLKGVFDDGLTSLSDFFDSAKAIRAAALKDELAALDREIAAAEKLKASADKPETRQQAENAIAEARAKRARKEAAAAQVEILAEQERERQVKQTAFAYYDFLASIKLLTGNADQAFELTLPKKIDDARAQFAKFMSPQDAQAKADALAPVLRGLDAITRAQADYNRLTESLGITEKTIALDSQLAGTSELDSLKAIGLERQKMLPLQQAELEKAQAVADAIKSPETLLAAQKLLFAFRQAQAEADPVFLKIRDIGKEMGEAVANDADQAILHWQGFRNLLSSIEQDLLRISERELISKPFSNFLSAQFGGNGTAGVGGGLLGGLLSKLGLLGSANAAGGINSAGFGTGVGFGNLDFGGFFADGGTLKPGQWGIAGENGPEPIYAGATPLSVLANGTGHAPPVIIHQHFAPGTDRRTIDQAAQSAGAAVSRAQRRNG
jgi:hypothetical protein